MKSLIIVGLLGAGVLLTGCETTVVERDHGHGYGYGYRGDRRSTVYVDSGDRGRYDRGYDRNDYRGGYHTRNVERTNVNISQTNVNRTVVNRTNVNVKQAPRGGVHAVPQPQKHGQKKGGDNDRPGHDKKKDGDQQH